MVENSFLKCVARFSWSLLVAVSISQDGADHSLIELPITYHVGSLGVFWEMTVTEKLLSSGFIFQRVAHFL